MAKALFTTVEYVKSKSIISGNVDADKMIQFIETAQDMHIQNYLGSSLYRKLETLIIDETITDGTNAKYKLLLDEYIKPMLAWFAQAEYLPFAAYTISNKGVFQHRSEDSDSVNPEIIAGLASRANDKASHYAQLFIDFMCDNGDDYDEYKESSQDMAPDKDTDSFGWFLGN